MRHRLYSALLLEKNRTTRLFCFQITPRKSWPITKFCNFNFQLAQVALQFLVIKASCKLSQFEKLSKHLLKPKTPPKIIFLHKKVGFLLQIVLAYISREIQFTLLNPPKMSQRLLKKRISISAAVIMLIILFTHLKYPASIRLKHHNQVRKSRLSKISTMKIITA